MSSKITNAWVLECIKEMREKSKARKFTQTVDLQVALKDYDPARDKRFVGSVRLPNIPRPKMKVCLIADQKHLDEVKAAGIDVDVTTMDQLAKFNKVKKDIKKWAKKYHILLCTDSLIRKVPVVLGPVLNRIGKFPQPVTHAEPIAQKIDDVRGSVKWQLKKVTCLNVAAGNETMSDEELRQNIVMAMNFLASLLKKQWLNIKTINIKTTMGSAVQVL